MRETLKNLKRIVIKLGSESIIDQTGLNLSKIKEIAEDVKELQMKGIEVILISSGAIGVGRSYLKKENVETINFLQAASSIGQPKLMEAYETFFNQKDLTCAQILLTHDDFKNKTRYLNSKNTIEKLLQNKIIPILNENDTVSFNEITLGDNDELGGKTALMMEADLYLIISKTDGLYTESPERPEAKKIPAVNFNEKLKIKARSKTSMGRGGMKSKLLAIKKVTELGVKTLLAGSNFSHPIKRALKEEVGTLFYENKDIHKNKKSILKNIFKRGAEIHIDEGCKNALLRKKSLLPSGIISVKGSFTRGDTVQIIYQKKVFAFGITEYSSYEIQKIKGKKSSEIKEVLGAIVKVEVIHIDNLILKA